MKEYKLYPDRNDPDFIRNCGERKTDEYLFDLAGYLFACGCLSEGAEKEVLSEIAGKLKKLKAQKGVSGVLWSVMEEKIGDQELAELAIQTIHERNMIKSDAEWILFYNHLWCSTVCHLFKLKKDAWLSAPVIDRLAGMLPDAGESSSRVYPYGALIDAMMVFIHEGRARMRLLLILKSIASRNNGCLALEPIVLDAQLDAEYGLEYTDNPFKRTWVQFTGKSPYAQRKKLHEIVERLGGGIVENRAKTDLLVCCLEGSDAYATKGVGTKMIKAMMPGSGTVIIQEEEFWKEVELASGMSREEWLSEK